ncbi:MAG TPA: efflux RND transporter periplasmic adaptor subunit, partial [Blastocatellia bacterium]|nr:efflux RND transporter periplasmic adaptor subunit [Blastocatellia bacterium]
EGVTRYVVRNAATGRYFLLKEPEYQVFCRFDGARTLPDIAKGDPIGKGPRVAPAALVKFLAKLDSLGLIARGGPESAADSPKQQRGLYIRIHLFNPNRMLAWLDRRIGWALTRPFIIASFILMFVVVFGMLSRADEVLSYMSYTYSAYGLAAIILMTLTITALHEFAHGLACKHFGGEVRELGVLMIYYVLPAFYCNVSDIYRFGKKSQRLWVIFAGIYWQLGVSAAAALVWLLATPYTWLADFMFLVFLGGTFNILINCNPLIKLDGYYALSQALGIPNLQARSAEYVRSLWSRFVNGPGSNHASRITHHASLYLTYWLCSILYSVALIWFILGWAGGALMDWLGFAGVLLTLLLAALLTEKWWKPMGLRIADCGLRVAAFFRNFQISNPKSQIRSDGGSTMSAQPAMQKTETEPAQATGKKRWLPTRRRVIKAALGLLVIAVLVAPWEASTGSDCALLLPPGREEVVRANTDAVLAEIYVQQGDTVAAGAKIARLANPEIEDRLTQLNAEIERLTANASRLEDELRVRSELTLSANFKEHERKRVADDLKDESSRIIQWNAGASPLPPSLAVMESEIELKRTELEHNKREAERYRKLYEQGLVGEQQYDRAVAAVRLTEKELQGARARLEAALVEHRRQTSGAETGALVAETEARAARSSFESLINELHANREQLESLRQRRDILQREYDGMHVLAARAGVVLGDDLRRNVGRRYSRGDEICRIGELEKFLLRIEVSEREIANVRLDSPVRFKLKTVPGRTFTGQVAKINAEPILNPNGQRFYPVEVQVENADGLLRPGMTGFARIDFGRQSVGLILAEKVWHALRPELWLF